MNAVCSKIFKINLLLITLLLTISCDKESDLLTDYVPFDALNKEQLDEFVADDFFNTDPDQSVVPDGSAKDTFTDLETVKIIQTSAAASVGSLQLNGIAMHRFFASLGIFEGKLASARVTFRHNKLNRSL
ncbi:MAG: hypothetical protein KAJ23_00010 [Maribacter sp.]|nr:hypothetical protein [Maribacter sp.]